MNLFLHLFLYFLHFAFAFPQTCLFLVCNAVSQDYCNKAKVHSNRKYKKYFLKSHTNVYFSMTNLCEGFNERLDTFFSF